ncbi:CPBP family intramembrane glutamic endopeptidase [Halomicroarcula sp. GCM10025817]|uniref:CPBP family intramembrane glutamic endopeptidase n=1 Tax=Haloarcula TaxID=2237 RepID=UPI0023E78835|nr:type II CAAX endopeptidase family protein [Halomicroarcula sp. SYNS111]
MSSPDPDASALRWTVPEVVGLTAVAILISLVAGVAFVVPVLALGFDLGTTPVLVGATAAGQVGLLLVAYAFVRRRTLSVRVARPSRREVGEVVGWTLVALVVAVGASALLSAAGLVPESVIQTAAERDPTILLALALLSIVLVAPAEELLFRGAIQGRLRQRYGPKPAIAGASVLFGSVHLTNFTGALPPILATIALLTAVGAVFGVAYERTGNLAVPIAVHATYNLVLLSVSFLSL